MPFYSKFNLTLLCGYFKIKLNFTKGKEIHASSGYG